MSDRIPEIQKGLAAAVAATENLAHKVDALASKVDLGDAATTRLKSNHERLNLNQKITAVSVLLDILLTIAFGWGLVGVNNNQTKINELQSAVQHEADRTRSGQCAVITLFLQFEPKTLANPAYTEEQHAQQMQAYATLKQIATDLECPQ